MTTISTHLERLIEAPSIQEIWALHLEKMSSYGFDRLLYGFTRFRTSNSFGNMEDILLLSNYPPEYLRTFIQGGMFHHAQLLRRR